MDLSFADRFEDAMHSPIRVSSSNPPVLVRDPDSSVVTTSRASVRASSSCKSKLVHHHHHHHLGEQGGSTLILPASSSSNLSVPTIQVGSQMPRIQVNLSGTPVNLQSYFQSRRGLIMGLVPTPNTAPDDDIELQESLSTLCRLSRRHADRMDFVGCVMPVEASAVRSLAKAAHVVDEVTFISDSRRKFFTKVGGVTPEGECRQFCVFVSSGSCITYCRYGPLGSTGMRDLERLILQDPSHNPGSSPINMESSRAAIRRHSEQVVMGSKSAAGAEDSEPERLARHLLIESGSGTTTNAMSTMLSNGGGSDVTAVPHFGQNPFDQPTSGSKTAHEETDESSPKRTTSTEDRGNATPPNTGLNGEGGSSGAGMSRPESGSPSGDESDVTPRTRALLEKRRTTGEISKWSTSLLASSTRNLSGASGAQEVILCGYSYRDVSFEYPSVFEPFECVVTVGNSEIEIIPTPSVNLGHCYYRGATFRTVNLHFHLPSEHLLSEEEDGLCRGAKLFEVFVVHELAGGRGGDRRPLVYACSFSAVARVPRNELLDGLLSCRSSQKAQFCLASLVPPAGESLLRYSGDLRLLDETVTWVVRRAAVEIPLEQANELLDWLQLDPLSLDAIDSRSSHRTNLDRSPNGTGGSKNALLASRPSPEELYALSFAPFRRRPSPPTDLASTTEMAVLMRETCNIGFKMLTDALQFAEPDQPSSDILLLLLDSFSERLRTELQALSAAALLAARGGEELKTELAQLEETSKSRRFHPLRRPLFEAFLDLDANAEWLSPALLRHKVAQLAEKHVDDEVECEDDEQELHHDSQPQYSSQDEEEDATTHEPETTVRDEDEYLGSPVKKRRSNERVECRDQMERDRERLSRMIQMAEFMQEFDRELSVLSSFDDQTKANTAENGGSAAKPASSSAGRDSSSSDSSAYGASAGAVSRSSNYYCSSAVPPPPPPQAAAALRPALKSCLKNRGGGVPQKKQNNQPAAPPFKSALKNNNPRSALKGSRDSMRSRVKIAESDNNPEWATDNKRAPPSSRRGRRLSGQPTTTVVVSKRGTGRHHEEDSEIDDEEEESRNNRRPRTGTRRARIAADAPRYLDEESDDSWEVRKEERCRRIASRHPTGHPVVGAKAAELKKQLAAITAAEKQRPARRAVCMAERMVDVIDDESCDEEWEFRKEERCRRIASRHPTGHPVMAAKAAQLRQQLAEIDQSDSDDSGVGGVVMHDTTKSSRRPTTRNNKVKVTSKCVYVDNEGDSDWERRKAERSKRISARQGTGHPAMAAKAAALRQQLAMMDVDDDDSDDSDDDSAEQPKQQRRVHVASQKVYVDDDSDDDGSWERRKAERSQRISARHGTGHPMVGAKAAALKQQLAALQQELDQDDDDDDPPPRVPVRRRGRA